MTFAEFVTTYWTAGLVTWMALLGTILVLIQIDDDDDDLMGL